jgi:hypothetical protein
MVRKQEPKKHFGWKTISLHYTAPKGSLRDERQVPHFVLVSLDYSWERQRHVIDTRVLPQFWKVYNLEKQNHGCYFTATTRSKTKPMILFYLHVSTELNTWTHSHCPTGNCEGMRTATGCGIHRLVMHMRGDFRDAYGKTTIVKLWGSSKNCLNSCELWSSG